MSIAGKNFLTTCTTRSPKKIVTVHFGFHYLSLCLSQLPYFLSSNPIFVLKTTLPLVSVSNQTNTRLCISRSLPLSLSGAVTTPSPKKNVTLSHDNDNLLFSLSLSLSVPLSTSLSLALSLSSLPIFVSQPCIPDQLLFCVLFYQLCLLFVSFLFASGSTSLDCHIVLCSALYFLNVFLFCCGLYVSWWIF